MSPCSLFLNLFCALFAYFRNGRVSKRQSTQSGNTIAAPASKGFQNVFTIHQTALKSA